MNMGSDMMILTHIFRYDYTFQRPFASIKKFWVLNKGWLMVFQAC